MSKPVTDKINRKQTNQTVEVEDLPVKMAAQQEVKGGNRSNQKTYTGILTLDTSTTIGE